MPNEIKLLIKFRTKLIGQRILLKDGETSKTTHYGDTTTTVYQSQSQQENVQDVIAAPTRQGIRTCSTTSPTCLSVRSNTRTNRRKHHRVMENNHFRCISRRRKKATVEKSYTDTRSSPPKPNGIHLVHKLQNMSRFCHSSGLLEKTDAGSGAAGLIRNRVKDTLRLYQATVRKLLRDQQSKPKNVLENHRSKRADLLAARILKEKHRWVNSGKKISGAVPGVEVGDEFHFRAELAIVGLHHPFQGGIDFFKTDNGKFLATSIVTAWCYADDMEDSDELVYLGQGGNTTIGGDKKVEDQKLEGANLSLKNCIHEKTPVRVIRGIEGPKGNDSLSTRGKLVSTYTYDGLYMVERYWQEKGSQGANVFKFLLRRIPKQPELAIKELNKLTKDNIREGHCVDDISHGKEKMRIGVVNTIDDEDPPTFDYITSMRYPWCYNLSLTPPNGCKCTDNCADPLKCGCAVKNGGEIPFNHNGAIVEEKPVVYECGPSCKCPPTCYNRVSQHGIKFQLEIFKTDIRGWGVRALTSIPSGCFVCEYTGELLRDKEAEQRISKDEYLFDIGDNFNDHVHWEGFSKCIPADWKSSFSSNNAEDVAFTIDAAHYGNVGRFINHCCSPNLYAQNVLYDHADMRIPHIMLFAAENIPPLQELTLHYNYKLDQVRDSHGNIKKKNCYCGSHGCSGRMY